MISIHTYILVLLVITCLECGLTFVEYDAYNQSGKRLLAFVIFNVLFSALRNTLARLIILLLSLGYGTVMNTLSRYLTKIGLLCFMFFIADTISQACYYINQHKPLSATLKVMLTSPEIFIDILFLIWISSALLRTLSYLRLKN